MSLESQIGSLVEATNNLTGTVAGKMKEIDQKVDQAVGSIPDAMMRLADQVFYIDASRGNDNNTGKSSGDALRTLHGLDGRLVPGAFVRIFLANDNTYDVEGSAFRAQNNIVYIRAFSLASDALPIIRWRPEHRGEGASNTGVGILFSGGSLTLVNIDLDIANAEEGELGSSSAFVRTDLTKLDIFIRRSHVNLKNAPLCVVYNGFDSIDMHFNGASVSVEENANGRARLMSNRVSSSADAPIPFRLSMRSLSIRGGLGLRDHFPVSDSGKNILTEEAIPAI